MPEEMRMIFKRAFTGTGKRIEILQINRIEYHKRRVLIDSR